MYIWLALRRKKDTGLKGKVIKEFDYDRLIERLKRRNDLKGQQWRIYRTVNKRDIVKAKKMFLKRLIDDNKDDTFMDQIFYSCLLNPACKAEKKFLIDIDNTDIKYCLDINKYLVNNKIHILENSNTPNGYHIITNGFDSRELLLMFKDVEIKKDALFFQEMIVL